MQLSHSSAWYCPTGWRCRWTTWAAAQSHLTCCVSPCVAGHRRSGTAAAHAAHRPGVHGPEAGTRHQALSPDRARQDGLLQAVCQMRTIVAPPGWLKSPKATIVVSSSVEKNRKSVELDRGTPQSTSEPRSVRNLWDYEDILSLCFFSSVFFIFVLHWRGIFSTFKEKNLYFPFLLWGYPNCLEEMYFII